MVNDELRRIRDSDKIPSHVDRYDGWLSGDKLKSIKFEKTSYLFNEYEKLDKICSILSTYGSLRKFNYYWSILRRVVSELDIRGEVFKNNPEEYFELYGIN